MKKKAINENEIVRAITDETCKRLESWLEKNKDSLKEKLKDFDDQKKAFKSVILKKLMAILTQMEEEYKGKLDERDMEACKVIRRFFIWNQDDNDGQDYKLANKRPKNPKNLD